MRKLHIVAVSVVLSLVSFIIMVVVARFLWTHNRSSKDQNPSDVPVQQETSLLSRARSVTSSSTRRKERGNWAPTLSGIIKAGDESIFSSSLLNAQHGIVNELSLQDLYETFANGLRNRPVAERGAYNSEINKFLSTNKSVQRKQPVSVSPTPPRRPDVPRRGSRKSVDVIRNSIDLTELGIGRSRSTRKATTSLVSLLNNLPAATSDSGPLHTNWDQDLRHTLVYQGHTAIPVTAQELSALSVVLGSPVDISLDAQDEKCDSWANTYKGALGVSIAATATSDGSYHISLVSNKRSISQLPAKGSGYSTLHAKHLASGALPFASKRKTTDTIIITNTMLEHLRKGSPLSLQPTSPETAGARFLARLPNSRAPSFYTCTPSTTAKSTHGLIHAIGDLVFTGGLTPFAAIPLIKTVQFVACGGLVPGRLLQRLDALVGKVHHQAPHLQLFGPLLEDSNAHLRFRVNEKLARIATSTLRDEPLADKVARMSRYTTLLERLMALVPDMSSTEVLKAVRAGMKSEMERSYEEAVAAHLISDTILSVPALHQGKPNPSAPRSIVSNNSSGTASPSSPASLTSGRPSSTFPKHNLGRQLEDVLKSRLPLDIQTIVMVARLVLVAWTLSVESVAWEEGEAGFRVVDPARLPESMYMW